MTTAKIGHNVKKLTSPTIKNRAKFVKKVAVPKSAKYNSGSEGDWGKSNG